MQLISCGTARPFSTSLGEQYRPLDPLGRARRTQDKGTPDAKAHTRTLSGCSLKGPYEQGATSVPF